MRSMRAEAVYYSAWS